jgi:hypothetical protein
MTVEEFDIALSDLETRIDRLRALYENWFRGYEKTEPSVPRKDAERRVYALRKELPRNTALRFRYHQTYLKYTTLANYWQRTARQIEEGTYKPQLQRLKRKLDREQEMLERRERRKLERPEEQKEDGPRGYELDLDESLDVDDLLDELEMDEVAKAIDRPGLHSEPPPTTVHQRLPPANGPAMATFSRQKDTNAAKPQAPVPQPTQDAPARGAAFPNAPFPNAPFPNAPGKTGPMAAPPLAGATTLGRPAPPAGPPPSPQAARGPSPLAAPQASRPGTVPFAAPAPGSGAQRPFPNAPLAPSASSANGAGAPAAPQGTRPAAPNPLGAGAPARPASTIIGRPAPGAPAAPVGTAGQRPVPTAPVGTAGQRAAPTAPLSTAGQRAVPTAPVGSAAQRMSPGAAAPGGGTYVGRPPVASPLAGPAGAPNEQRLRHIYDEYTAARRRNNEGEVRYEALVSSIQKMLPELNKKHQGKQIDFDVVVKDGRVGLKPKAT